MGLYLLNISVDTADPYPEYIPEDLSINDQESIVEIVVEKILGYENAIEEYDDHKTEDHNKKTNLKIESIVRLTDAFCISRPVVETKKEKFHDLPAYLITGIHQLNTPPPKI